MCIFLASLSASISSRAASPTAADEGCVHVGSLMSTVKASTRRPTAAKKPLMIRTTFGVVIVVVTIMVSRCRDGNTRGNANKR